MVQESHFTERELACRCRSCKGAHMPAEIHENLRRLMAALESIRTLVGHPVVVTSGYRCPTHNRKVGGAPQSVHLSGLAADIKVKGYSGVELLNLLEAAISEQKLPDGGIGVYNAYPNLLHYDLGKPRRWRHVARRRKGNAEHS